MLNFSLKLNTSQLRAVFPAERHLKLVASCIGEIHAGLLKVEGDFVQEVVMFLQRTFTGDPIWECMGAGVGIGFVRIGKQGTRVFVETGAEVADAWNLNPHY